MIEIEGLWWFVGALLICGAHGLYLRSWRRERLDHLAWWKKYDADAQTRHEEFMCMMDRRPDVTWPLPVASQTRGQA